MSSWKQPLTFWEKVQEAWNRLIVYKTLLSVSITAAFRGKDGAKQYKVHVLNALTRKVCVTFTERQLQCVLILLTTGHCLLTSIPGSRTPLPMKYTDSSWPAEVSSRRLCLSTTALKVTGLATEMPKMSLSTIMVSRSCLPFLPPLIKLILELYHTNPAVQEADSFCLVVPIITSY